MGYIYIITNKVNEKQYIGQTEGTIEHRWKIHLKDVYKKQNEQRPLYSAIRKYGSENFTISILEEVDNSQLSTKEIFYIEKYKTYSNGYNATVGGDGRSYIPQEEKNLYKDKFYELKSIHRVADFFDRDTHTISEHLKSIKIDVNMFRNEVINPQFQTKKIKNIELGLEFDSVVDAAKYLVDQKMTNASVNSARVSIGRAVSGLRKSYLGYTWKQV